MILRAISLLTALGWIWLAGLALLGLLGFGVRRNHFESAGLAFGVGLGGLAWLSRRATGTTPETASRAPAFVYLIPAAIALLAFQWSIDLGPLSDDFLLHKWASAGEWVPGSWAYVRPLPLAIWQAIAASGGGWTALHGLNLLVHAVNSALVARIGAAWMGPMAGLVAGLAFALFPAGTEAVAWSAGIFDLLATLFVLLAVVIWNEIGSSTRRDAALVSVSVAGFLSKESAFVIPALLCLITLSSTRGWSGVRARARPLALTIAITTIVLASRMLFSSAVAGHFGNLPSDRREWKDLLVRPFASLAVPVRTDVGIGADAYLVGGVVLLLLGMAIARIARASFAGTIDNVDRSRASSLSVGLGWVLVSSLPLLSQFFVSPTLEGSRYLYLPAAGFAIAISAAFAGTRFGRAQFAAAIPLVALLGLDGAGLSAEKHVWREAARTRDAVLAEASRVVRSVPCRTLAIHDAPDNVKGAFVFREGLEEALTGLPMNPAGTACVFRWNGSILLDAAGS